MNKKRSVMGDCWISAETLPQPAGKKFRCAISRAQDFVIAVTRQPISGPMVAVACEAILLAAQQHPASDVNDLRQAG
jgi:hypothetical protein